MLYRAYDEARRAAVYLRWHEGDADEIVPSLYAGRGGRGKSEPDTSERQPTPTSVSPVAPVAGSPHAAPVPTKPVIPGQPGGSPFLS